MDFYRPSSEKHTALDSKVSRTPRKITFCCTKCALMSAHVFLFTPFSQFPPRHCDTPSKQRKIGLGGSICQTNLRRRRFFCFFECFGRGGPNAGAAPKKRGASCRTDVRNTCRKRFRHDLCNNNKSHAYRTHFINNKSIVCVCFFFV